MIVIGGHFLEDQLFCGRLLPSVLWVAEINFTRKLVEQAGSLERACEELPD